MFPALSRRGFIQGTGLVGAGLMAGLPFSSAFAAPVVGQMAPAFTGTDISGKAVSLSDYKGKLVVLEWTNHGCPFVRKHYDTGNMQAVQADATAKGAVWLTIVSSALGEQGYVTADEAKARIAAEKWAASTTLLDPQGLIGRAYDAKVTPHMYIIGTDGTLLYNGAIDDKPTANKADIAEARNHIRDALADIQAGRPVAMASTRPYGCGVKYSKATT